MSAREATVLERILAETREEIARRKREMPLPPTVAEGSRNEDGGGRFRDALRAPGLGVIAEFKRRSPSAGTLRGSSATWLQARNTPQSTFTREGLFSL